jgi:glycosyltransferase involved in cell wall biosynthesis
MNEYAPTVTVLMPVYNGEKYIAEAIDSVLEQTYTDYEFLIVDDGSTDTTAEIISFFNDPRISLIHHPVNMGIAVALNTGLFSARGKYIARFDADDICLPERLAVQFNFLAANDDYMVIGSNAEYIDESGEHLFSFICIGHTDEEIKKRMALQCPFIHSSVMFKKEAVLLVGGYSIHAHNFEDYFLWTQLKGFGKFNNISHTLIKVRFNPSSVTIDEKCRGKVFRKIKSEIILRGTITKEEGEILCKIIKSQDVHKIKESSYYSLCGKKYLINNHQPRKARSSLSKAISIHPSRLENYALYFLSYFPASFIHLLHKNVLPKFDKP